MSLPPRGTGLLTGRARTERGKGTPLTETERLERHYANDSNNLDDVLLVLAALVGAGFLIWLISKR